LSFSSDHFYCLHFCDDVIHGRDLHGWHLPAAPYLFPDMVLVGVLELLTSDPGMVFLTYSILYYLVLLAVLVAIFYRMGIPPLQAFTTGALGLTSLFASCFHPDYMIRSLLLFHPGNHMTCQLIGLAATGLALHVLTRGYPWRSAVLLILVCGL